MSTTDAVTAEAGTGRVMLITLRVGGQRFALPLDSVREIVRPPAIIPVPLGPAALAGLANMRGIVTAVVSLHGVLGLPDSASGDATRILVIEGAEPIGFMADAVDGLFAADREAFEDPGDEGATVDDDLLAGMIADGQGPALMVLDPARVVGRAFAGMRWSDRRSAPVAAPRHAGGATRKAAEGDGRRLDLLSFEADHQEFALPVQAVEEVVRLPGAVSRVPHADDYILGVVGLRDRLVPLVSLHRLLGLRAVDGAGSGRVLVVSMEGVGVVGLVVDRTRQILRIPAELADPVPPLLARQGAEEIEAICRLDGGRRLVSILSAERLFRNDLVRRAVSGGGVEEDELDRMPEKEAETFIVFRLGRVEYGLPVAAVREILRRPGELATVPRTPDFIAGMVNVRGTALPVVDQRRRFGLEAHSDGRERIIVVSMDGVSAGFMVDAVLEVRRIPDENIGDAPDLSNEQMRLISRVATLDGRMILLLRPEQLLDRDEVGSVVEIAGDGAP